MKIKGVTLIECLIVAAIIAVISMLANPSYYRSSTRSKVSRVKADQRILSSALESYFADFRTYPDLAIIPIKNHFRNFHDDKNAKKLIGISTFAVPDGIKHFSLTTPVNYLSSYPVDPFAPFAGSIQAYYHDKNGWIVWSAGPDKSYNLNYWLAKKHYDIKIPQQSLYFYTSDINYDPTNGIESGGDIYRVRQ